MKTCLSLGALLATTTIAHALPVASDVVGNGTLADAFSVDGLFDTGFNADVGTANLNTSETIPYITISGTADADQPDYFAFDVLADASTAIFDIDRGLVPMGTGFAPGSEATEVGVWRVLPGGGFNLITSRTNPQGSRDDGSPISGTDPTPRTTGSERNEPLFDLTLDAGRYVVGVSGNSNLSTRPNDNGFRVGFDNNFGPATYDLQLSVQNSVVVPEPASLALIGLGGLAALRRRR